MVILNEIPLEELAQYVFLAFEDDNDLMDKYHIQGGDLEECVNHTLVTIIGVEKEYELHYYSVLYNNLPIGFLVLGDKFLFSFGIAIKYRTKEILQEWWQEIIKVLNNEFAALLWNKNTRAIDFLKKNGMESIKESELITSLTYIN